jgi:hypothetical protein
LGLAHCATRKWHPQHLARAHPHAFIPTFHPDYPLIHPHHKLSIRFFNRKTGAFHGGLNHTIFDGKVAFYLIKYLTQSL